jgi:hypothetical protein
MKAASQTSNTRQAPKKRRPVKTYPFATSNTRGRKREARRWLDVLTVRCTNGAHNPNPLPVPELGRRWRQAFEDLQRQDRTLFDAVHQCMWDDWLADKDITIEEWRRRSPRVVGRIKRLRAEMRQAGTL